MTPSQLDLARRITAHPAFKWAPGMLPLRWSDTRQAWVNSPRLTESYPEPEPGCVPDLDDDATKGALLGLVRAAWGTPFAQITPWLRFNADQTAVCTGWRVCLNNATEAEIPARGERPAPTEGVALALALLALP